MQAPPPAPVAVPRKHSKPAAIETAKAPSPPSVEATKPALAQPAPMRQVEDTPAAVQPEAKPAEPPTAPVSIFIGKPVALAEFSAETWPAIFPQLTLTGVTRSIASHCAFQAVQGSACSMLLDTRHAALFNEEHRKRIEQALADYFGTALQVTIETGTPSSETPAARRLRMEDERKLAAVRDFTHDPAVQALVDRFGAEILYDSITSLAPPHQ